MPKEFELVTGNEVLDISLHDMARSAHQLAKEFRGVSQVSRSCILFEVTSCGVEVEATKAKKGHNNLIRLMLTTRDEMVLLQKLRNEISDDPTATIADKLKAAAQIQKGLAELTNAALKIEAAAERAAEKSNDFLLKLEQHKQQWQMHKDRLSANPEDDSDAKLAKLAEFEVIT